MNNAVYASIHPRSNLGYLSNHMYAIFYNAYANGMLLYKTSQFDELWEYRELKVAAVKFFRAEQPFDLYAVKNNIQLHVIIDIKGPNCTLSLKPMHPDNSVKLDFYILSCIELCENYALIKLTTEEPGNEEFDF